MPLYGSRARSQRKVLIKWNSTDAADPVVDTSLRIPVIGRTPVRTPRPKGARISIYAVGLGCFLDHTETDIFTMTNSKTPWDGGGRGLDVLQDLDPDACNLSEFHYCGRSGAGVAAHSAPDH